MRANGSCLDETRFACVKLGCSGETRESMLKGLASLLDAGCVFLALKHVEQSPCGGGS